MTATQSDIWPANSIPIEPGIYPGVPLEQYRRWQAWNPSLVKHARTSLLQVWHALHSPPAPPTPQQVLGAAEHCAVLEPDEFPRRYVLWQGRRAGKAYEQFELANAGMTILRDEEYDKCCAMRRAVVGHMVAAPIVTDPDAKRECSLCWDDPNTGLRCKGRVDLLSDCIADLKTIRECSDFRMTRECCDYHYHMSMAAYRSGVEVLSGKQLPIRLVFVSSSAPHDVAVRSLEDDSLACGHERWCKCLAKIRRAIDLNHWPGVCEDRVWPLILPQWELDAEGDMHLSLGGEDIEL